ncbi:RDD family protein [Herbidospora daliensis]|uniref:RDD family protein n=1 Tax=Herbidospora daliensis TaxID=295585 RepID=UPI000B0DBE84|nr:RDD family protein [Herbidospora daliensis]
MSTLSRPALLTWLVAAAVAAYPTWEEWRFRLDPGPLEFFCLGDGWLDVSPLDPLRGDLDTLLMDVEAFAIPSLLIIMGAFFARQDARRAGRRTAGVLVLIAVVKPATPLYSSPEECGGTILILSGEWFATVVDSWGSTQVCLIAAAVLVLLVTWRKSASSSTGRTWRRVVAFLVDYLALIVILSLPGLSYSLGYGLLNSATVQLDVIDFDRWLVVLVVFLYFWVQHRLWGQTLGKRLAGVHIVPNRRMALRTVLSLLVFVAVVGPVVLIVDGMWALLDPEGRALHDRLLKTEVTRTVRDEVGV